MFVWSHLIQSPVIATCNSTFLVCWLSQFLGKLPIAHIYPQHTVSKCNILSQYIKSRYVIVVLLVLKWHLSAVCFELCIKIPKTDFRHYLFFMTAVELE